MCWEFRDRIAVSKFDTMIMSTLDVFSTSITYRYKTRVCSIASLVVFILTTALVILPLILAYQSGGFWVRNRVYIETPLVQFTHKYLLIAEGDFDSTPIICSTFSVYQLNPIKDDCTLVKIQQLDINNDKHNDLFKFNFLFYSRAPVKSIKLLFFFQLKLRVNKQFNYLFLIIFLNNYNYNNN